ncbi:MAG: YncE family protein, partial [Actinomycetota bacterium]|nr:YncE family protein [Actinomycetota bacterium]
MSSRRVLGLALLSTMALAACGGTSDTRALGPPRVVATLPAGTAPHFPAVDPTSNRLFVSNLKAGALSVLSLPGGEAQPTVPVGMTPHTVAIEAGANRVWVTDMGSGEVSVIDARTMQTAATMAVGKLPHGLAIDAAHHRAYVTNVADDTVSVIDTTQLKVVETFSLASPEGTKAWPWGVAVDAKAGRLYVTATGQLPQPDGTLMSNGSDRLIVLNLADGRPLASVAVGAGPWNVAVDQATGTAYVGVTSTNEVVAVRGDRVVGRVPVGDNPHGVVLDTGTHRLFVNNAKSDSVSVIDVGKLAVTATVAVGRQPQGIALDPG